MLAALFALPFCFDPFLGFPLCCNDVVHRLCILFWSDVDPSRTFCFHLRLQQYPGSPGVLFPFVMILLFGFYTVGFTATFLGCWVVERVPIWVLSSSSQAWFVIFIPPNFLSPLPFFFCSFLCTRSIVHALSARFAKHLWVISHPLFRKWRTPLSCSCVVFFFLYPVARVFQIAPLVLLSFFSLSRCQVPSSLAMSSPISFFQLTIFWVYLRVRCSPSFFFPSAPPLNFFQVPGSPLRHFTGRTL